VNVHEMLRARRLTTKMSAGSVRRLGRLACTWRVLRVNAAGAVGPHFDVPLDEVGRFEAVRVPTPLLGQNGRGVIIGSSPWLRRGRTCHRSPQAQRLLHFQGRAPDAPLAFNARRARQEIRPLQHHRPPKARRRSCRLEPPLWATRSCSSNKYPPPHQTQEAQ
jgi:hypothetical protein